MLQDMQVDSKMTLAVPDIATSTNAPSQLILQAVAFDANQLLGFIEKAINSGDSIQKVLDSPVIDDESSSYFSEFSWKLIELEIGLEDQIDNMEEQLRTQFPDQNKEGFVQTNEFIGLNKRIAERKQIVESFKHWVFKGEMNSFASGYTPFNMLHEVLQIHLLNFLYEVFQKLNSGYEAYWNSLPNEEQDDIESGGENIYIDTLNALESIFWK